jgi:hypothetical protein
VDGDVGRTGILGGFARGRLEVLVVGVDGGGWNEEHVGKRRACAWVFGIERNDFRIIRSIRTYMTGRLAGLSASKLGYQDFYIKQVRLRNCALRRNRRLTGWGGDRRNAQSERSRASSATLVQLSVTACVVTRWMYVVFISNGTDDWCCCPRITTE